jgi:hypothetical protein
MQLMLKLLLIIACCCCLLPVMPLLLLQRSLLYRSPGIGVCSKLLPAWQLLRSVSVSCKRLLLLLPLTARSWILNDSMTASSSVLASSAFSSHRSPAAQHRNKEGGKE